MSNINTRVFGSPIPNNVREILEQRQKVAAEAQPGEPIDKLGSINFPNSKTPSAAGSLADLSSRTPFARMWCAVELHDKNITANARIYDWQDADRQTGAGGGAANITAMDAFARKVDPKLDFTNVFYDKTANRYYVNDPKSKAFTTRNFVVDRKVYTIGNHVLNTESNVPNKPSNPTPTQKIFPSEHEVENDYNKFMKPQAGITAITSNTKELGNVMKGALRETTVSFVVHNFHDFDRIYNRYFMKPGAQIFLDFGWDVNDLYDIQPEDVERLQEKIYGVDGFLSESQGNMETIMGVVTNYDARIMQNGSIECSVTLVSKNYALATYDIGNSKERIDFILDNLIFFDGVVRSAGQQVSLGGGTKKEVLEEITDYLNDNANTTSTNLDIIEGWLFSFAEEWWNSSTIFLPGQNVAKDTSLDSGVFIASNSKKTHSYIQFGKLEDFLLNGEFGFGDDKHSINNTESSEFESFFDSTNSFTTWNEDFYNKQQTVSNSNKAMAPYFLYPEYWYYMPKEASTRKPYNVQVQKTPLYNSGAALSIDPKTFKRIASKKSMGDRKDYYDYDKVNNRIPIRELFIRKDLIQNAFSTGKSLLEAMEDLVEMLNTYSGGLMKFALAKIPGNDAGFAVVDELLPINKTHFAHLENYDMATRTLSYDVVGNSFENLFEFDVMGKNSIVTNYDLSFKLPSDKISNLIALQAGTPVTAQAVLSNEDMEDLHITKAILGRVPESAGDVYIQHLPDMGQEQLNKTEQLNREKIVYEEAYKSAIDSIKEQVEEGPYDNLYSNLAAYSTDIGRYVEEQKEDASSNSSGGSTYSSKTSVTTLSSKRLEEKYQEDRIYVANTIEDFYDARITGEIVKSRPTQIPIYLTLTTYGISSLQPGDVFKVNYLPKLYRDNVYLQTTKVSHQINTSGWYTTLETVMRMDNEKKYEKAETVNYTDVVLSYQFIANNLGIKIGKPDNIDSEKTGLPFNFQGTGVANTDGKSRDVTSMDQLANWITKIKPVPGGLDYEFIQKQMMKYRKSPNMEIGEDTGFDLGPSTNPVEITKGKINPETESITDPTSPQYKKFKAFSFEVSDTGHGQRVVFPIFDSDSDQKDGKAAQAVTWGEIIKDEPTWKEVIKKDWYKKNLKNLKKNQGRVGYCTQVAIRSKYGNHSTENSKTFPGGYHYDNHSGPYVPSIVLWKGNPSFGVIGGISLKYYLCLHPDYEGSCYTIIRAD